MRASLHVVADRRITTPHTAGLRAGMETSMITITEPNAVSREFDESIAPAVIRAWFATTSTRATTASS